MGNIVSSNYDSVTIDNITLKDSTLGNFIKEWAIDEYDDGYNYMNKNTCEEKHKSLLKKRACCTMQMNMRIALPEYNNTNGITGDFKYTPIKIPIFDSKNDMNDNCSIDGGDYYRKDTGEAPSNCKTLYGLEPQAGERTLEKCNFCDHIKMERQLMFSKDTDISENLKNKLLGKGLNLADIMSQHQKNLFSYGKYYNDSTLIRNVYADCNCRNSIFYNEPIEGKQNADSSTQYMSPYDIAHTFDTQCSIAGEEAYHQNQPLPVNCLQIQNIKDNTITNN